jgi:excisionase family DNA binding protein
MTNSKWLPIGEAVRLTGLSARTLKRLIAEGQLKSSRSPGGHRRVLLEDLDNFLRQSSAAPVSASSAVLQTKREGVELLNLEAQELRARRELERLRVEEAAEAERRAQEARAREAERQRQVELARAQRLREERERTEQEGRRTREAQRIAAVRERTAWEDRWINYAKGCFPGWLNFEQRQILLAAIQETVAECGPDDNMYKIVADRIAELAAGWESERREAAKRKAIIEQSMSRLPAGASEVERSQVASDTRAALDKIPFGASDAELAAAVWAGVERMSKVVEERKAAEAQAGKERRGAALRELSKSILVSAGVAHVSTYLHELHGAGEITDDALYDYEWGGQLERLVRNKLEAEFTGCEDESREDAERIAEETVDEELG